MSNDGDKNNSNFEFNYDLLLGRFLINELPLIKPRSIRLFVCAPYEDTFEETCKLFYKIFPKLREYSMSRYGLEFQAINLNWDVQNVSNIEEESLLEIEKCKSQSIGMTFLGIIGDEYGTPLPPSFIERQNFEILLSSLKENNLDYSYLQRYYRLNINYLSNKYELSNDLTNDIENKLTDSLIKATKIAVQKNRISSEFLNELNQTILQKLMNSGAFQNDSKLNRIFSYVRLNISDANANQNLKNTIEYLRDKEINYYFPVEQIYRIKINRKDENYLNNFGSHYQKLFENLIDKFVQKNPENEQKVLHDDVLYHLNYIRLNKLNEISTSTQAIMKTLTDYVLDDTVRQPFILTGNLGCGKSSLLATFASSLFLQLYVNERVTPKKNKHAILVRFIGIDGKTIYLRSLLKSICMQLNYIKKATKSSHLNEWYVPNRLNELKRYFKKILTENIENNESKLVIILDSLQDISRNDNSYKLDWLPKHLGKNCKLIMTVSSESDELLTRLRRKFTNQKTYANIDPLNQEQSEHMIRKLLEKKNYRLEPNQLNMLTNFVKTKPVLSLHLKLLSEEFLNWKSYTLLSECILKDNLKAAVAFYLKKLENKFGGLLVVHVLSYITIAESGISECELQDLLSLDNELLREFKINNLIKPTSNAIRIPWYYIISLLNVLKNHLIVKPCQGIYTIGWRHKIFNEVVEEIYLKSNPKFLPYLYKNMSDYYLGTWSNSRLKPLNYELIVKKEIDPNNKEKLAFDKPIVKKVKLLLDRLVPSQPIKYDDFHTHIRARYNLRKLRVLPYYLIKANMIKELFDNVLFNIEWIYSKINAFDLPSLLYDYDLYKEDVEVNLVCECLKMSEAAIIENPKLLFSELSGRLLPFYKSYDKLRYLIDSCDRMSAKLNPIIPIGQIYNSPSWIQQENLDFGINISDTLDIDLLESEFNGRILSYKTHNSLEAKFFDIDLMEQLNDINIGKGTVYCSKNGEFACTIEKNSRLIIKRIENGELYGIVNFEMCDIGHVHASLNYFTITLKKGPSPLVIDLKESKLLKTLPYHTCFCCISPDDKVLIIHSENLLYYYSLPSLERIIQMEAREIPEKVVFCKNNTKLFVLSKDTKQITYYSLIIEKKHQTVGQILQDRDIIDMKVSFDESYLLVCSLYCIYVLDLKSRDNQLLFKLKMGTIENYVSLDKNEANLKGTNNSNEMYRPASSSNFSSNSDHEQRNKTIKNYFTGFGCTINNKIIYATVYTYLVCYNAETGQIIRVFQSTLSANRIMKSYSSRISDALLSLLDDGKLILWNLKSIEFKDMKFEDMRMYNDAVVDCIGPAHGIGDNKQIGYAISYSNSSPDAKIHNLREGCIVQSILKCYDEEGLDNPLTTSIRSITIDDFGRFGFIIYDIEDFQGKRLPDDKDFLKKACSLIDLTSDNHRVIEKFSYIIRKNSRFEIQSKFMNKKSDSGSQEVYLLIKIINCINDFDPFAEKSLDWTDFETTIKLFGPIYTQSITLELYDEFKMHGECLDDGFCVTDDFYFTSLMHECNKLFDKQNPNIVKAKRYDLRMNLYELFECKKKSLKIQLFSLNEFLNYEEFSPKNILIDIRAIYNSNYLIIYSKEGPVSVYNKNIPDVNAQPSNKYDYDYERFRFERNIYTEKGAVIYDPRKNEVVKRFSTIFGKNTNVENLIISKGVYVIDNLWNLYDLNTGLVLYNIKINQSIQFNYQFTKFLFSGRYFLTTSYENSKIYVVRCYDAKIVATLRINDPINTIKTGESDRTIMVGTVNGHVICSKFLIDLEYDDAIENYVGYCRNYIKTTKTDSTRLLNLRAKQMTNLNEIVKDNLNNDLKRVVHSAHAHRQLKSRESQFSSYSTNNLYKQKTFNLLNNLNNDFHIGVAKNNLTKLSTGIKNSSVSTRACILQ